MRPSDICPAPSKPSTMGTNVQSCGSMRRIIGAIDPAECLRADESARDSVAAGVALGEYGLGRAALDR